MQVPLFEVLWSMKMDLLTNTIITDSLENITMQSRS